MYFAFGGIDAYVIADLPDNVAAAALALAVNQAGGAATNTVVLMTRCRGGRSGEKIGRVPAAGRLIDTRLRPRSRPGTRAERRRAFGSDAAARGSRRLRRAEQQVQAPASGGRRAEADERRPDERVGAEEQRCPTTAVPGDGRPSKRLDMRPTSADAPA